MPASKAAPEPRQNRVSAPPVYRPQPQTQTLQPRMTAPGQRQNSVSAPPVYHPQPQTRALQPKMRVSGPPQNRASAPPVYRPQDGVGNAHPPRAFPSTTGNVNPVTAHSSVVRCQANTVQRMEGQSFSGPPLEAPTQQPVKRTLRIHTVSRQETPNIYELTLKAFEQGQPRILTFVSNKESTVYVRNLASQRIEHISSLQPDAPRQPVTIRDVAREKALRSTNELSGFGKAGDENSRDEYPYASTLECGADAVWAYVPKTEQNIQGGKLRALYRQLQDFEKFEVKLDPPVW